VGGTTVAFDNPARRAFVVEMVPADDMNNAVSLNSALMTSSRVVGPALAGLLVATVGFGWCFLADGLSYLAVLAALWMMRTEELRPAEPTPRGKGQVRAGLRYARNTSVLWTPLAMMAVVGTLSYNFQTIFPLFATRDLHGTGTTFTILFSVVSVGALFGALGVARRRTINVHTVAMASFWYGVALTAMSVAPNQAVAYALGPLLGLTSIAFLTASTAIVQIEAAPDMRGRVLALQAVLFIGSTPIGGPIVGWVSQQFGARYAVGLGAAAALLAGLWGLMRARRLAEKPPFPDEEAKARASATEVVSELTSAEP
jgi:predicted MFS family arabinose efflux permease